ncbi:hypothetical protein HJFPF1_05942 [Paramyrothecium foliicola]|nr:hypothetical protein HJFPF1_05942 [Paramyrothecium foliicola]
MTSHRPVLGATSPNKKPCTPVPLPVIPSAARQSGSATPASDENQPPITSGGKAALPASKPAGSKKPAPRATGDKPAAASSKKRKSDAVEDKTEMFPAALDDIDDEDPRLDFPKDTCNAVRKMIHNWTDSGAMKIGEFQDALGVSSKAYGAFMNRNGTWDGEGCDTYWKAMTFFNKRRLLNLPLKAPTLKKPKKATAAEQASNLLDVSGVDLQGEQSCSVPVYDTCDEIRKKIRALLARDGITQAAFIREISKTYPDDKNVSAANLRYFMGRKGPLGGNTNATYYAAYVFFEKQRIKAGKPKSKFREEMEQVHGRDGVDVEHSSEGHVWVMAGESVHTDKYGKTHFTRRG